MSNSRGIVKCVIVQSSYTVKYCEAIKIHVFKNMTQENNYDLLLLKIFK